MYYLSDPSTEVLKRLAQKQFKRKQEDTQEELSAITSRINKTLNEFEECSVGNLFGSSTFFNEELKQLETLLKDSLLKNEYQQKLSVLIVDYKDVCSKRMDVLSQISEFFNIYATDENDDLSMSDAHVENLKDNILKTLTEMEKMFKHLDGTSRNVLDYMSHLHHLSSSKSKKNKKKLEKTLLQNKQEIEKMNTKLQSCQQDIAERDEKMKMLRSQLDSKRAEIALHNQQMAGLKNNFKLNEDSWKKELRSMSEELEAWKNQNLAAEDSPPAREIEASLKEIRDAAVSQLEMLKQKIKAETPDTLQIERELAEHLRVQLEQMRRVQSEELDQWRQECVVHVHQILDIEVKEEDSLKWMKQQDEDTPIASIPPQSASSEVQQYDDVDQTFVDATQPKGEDLKEVKKEVSRKENEEKDAKDLITKLNTLQSVNEQLKSKMRKMEDEKNQLLHQIEMLKQLQEEAEMDAMNALKKLEKLGVDETGEETCLDYTADQNPLSEKSEEAVRKASLSTFSKPASPTTGRSLVSAYRQKIADRRDVFTKQKVGEFEADTETPASERRCDSNLMEEHLRSYRAVMKFKDKIVEELIRHPNQHEKANIINEIPLHNYDTTNDHVHVHSSRMSASIESALKTIFDQLRGAISRADAPNLQEEVFSLQDELAEARGMYERRSQHDAAMIMHHVQNTQRGATGAGTSGSGFPSSPAAAAFSKSPGSAVHPPASRGSDGTILFTRRDAIHNEIALKKSAANGKITQETLESVTHTMAAYNAIPARRVRNLASKLLHHTTMKKIEMNVRNSNLLTSEVFAVLEKMEALQQRRAQLWTREMDDLTLERKRLALILFNALQRLESMTGVFLIKPILSYKGKGPMRKYPGKISTRFNKYQVEAMLRKMMTRKSESSHASVSTMHDHRLDAVPMNAIPLASDQLLSVSGFRSGEESNIWRADTSLPLTSPQSPSDKKSQLNYMRHQVEIPRLVELDVGRYQAGITLRPVVNPGMMGGRSVRMEGGRVGAGFLLARRDDQSPRNRVPNVSGEKTPSNRKSTAPPTTPASPLIDRVSVEFTGNNNLSLGGTPLPSIRKSPNRSGISSVESCSGVPTAFTPSRSPPDIREYTSTIITPFSELLTKTTKQGKVSFPRPTRMARVQGETSLHHRWVARDYQTIPHKIEPRQRCIQPVIAETVYIEALGGNESQNLVEIKHFFVKRN